MHCTVLPCNVVPAGVVALLMHPVAAAAASQTAPLRPAPATCCRDDIAAGMFKADPPSKQGLVASYSFLPENVEKSADGKVGGWAGAVAAALVQHAVLCCAGCLCDPGLLDI